MTAESRSTAGLASRIDTGLTSLTGIVSGIAVLGLLAGAMAVVIDVLLRWLVGGGVTALNEIMSQMFAMAVAATLPGGASRRANLKVDLMAGFFGPRLTMGLTMLGSALLAVFFGMLAYYIWALGLRFQSDGRDTLILGWPLAPTYFFASISLAVALLVQLVKIWRDIVEPPTAAMGGSSPAGMVLAVSMVATILGIAIWSVLDFASLQGAVFTAPGLSVAVAFALLWLTVLCQIPLAAASALIGVAGTAIALSLPATGRVFATDAMEFLSNWQVATLPLFLLMGSFAVVAGISSDIYRLASALLGGVRGGLAYTTVAGCAGFGAVSGSSIATAATFGRIALPEMARRNYNPALASGVVAAGGTLGSLVPPSGAIILFALLTEQSIGILFVAAMVPALLALFLYFGAIWTWVRLSPGHVPTTADAREPIGPALWQALPVVVLFGAVIGGLYGGVFTATESAAVGAVGAFLLALLRGKLTRDRLLDVLSETTATTALLYGLIFGALIFSFFVNLGQAPDTAARLIGDLNAAPIVILIVLLVFYLLLGAVMDSFAVMVITVPVVTPIVTGLGFDVIHWGILMLVVVEIGLISPPFGINLFVLKSLQPDQPIGRIMTGVLPFLAADAVKVAALVAFPALALWLPSTMN